jgi:uncharacterized LabA/DUF88 family protein
MVRDQKTERVMVFIDLRNVMNSQEEMTGLHAELDFKSMVYALTGRRNLVGTYMFDGKGGESMTRFHDALRVCGFRVIEREAFSLEGLIQKEVDVSMACEILSHAIKDHYDTAIIVSGDRDFRPVVEHIQFEGKRAEIAGFSHGMSSALRRSGDSFHCLDNIPMVRFETEQTDSDIIMDAAIQEEVATDA